MSNNSSFVVFSDDGDSSSWSFSSLLLLLFQVQTLELVLALVVFMTIHAWRQRRRRGLPSWPFLGMSPSLVIGLQGNMYEWISDVLRAQNGTFTFKGPWFTNLNCVVTSDPRNVEYLLKTNFSNFPKGKYFHDAVRDLLGDGIFSADGDTWRRQRKTASVEFHSSKFRRATADSLRELVVARLIPILEEFLENSDRIDLQDILLRLTFDNVCMIAFGVDPGCLRPGLPEIPFARAFEDATEATIMRFVTPTLVWKTMRFLRIGTEGKLEESIKGVDDFAREVIRARKKELSRLGSFDRSDLLTAFIRHKDDDGNQFSDRFLRDVCVNFILAGRDTSSVALSWFFVLLDKNPRVEKRILEEICGILRERRGETDISSVGLEDVIFRPEEVKRMEYLHAALSEALRLYLSVPVDHKEVLEDDLFPDGTELKKGTKIVYAIYAMGRMESVWGKDCREFRPERWMREGGGRRGGFTSEPAYKFAAFNGGPRLCLGRDFAYYQMKYVAASVLYRYRVVPVKGHRVVPKMALTMYLKYGLKVELFRRDRAEMDKYFSA